MKIFKKLLLSIIALVAVATCFTVSTYAWFQVNSEARVGDFEFKVTGGLGFMISVDGKNYYNDLSTEQMQMALLIGKHPDKYEIVDGNLVEKPNTVLSKEEVSAKLAEAIKLSPITSKNGIDFTNINGTEISSTSDKLAEFSLYFKSVSGNESDNIHHDIFLSGVNILPFNEFDPVHAIDQTIIESNSKDTVTLSTDMVIHDKDGIQTLGPTRERKTIDVYSSNASRLSIIEDREVKPGDVARKAPIYELVNDSDLGSYATTYGSKEYPLKPGEDEATLNRLYNSSNNAMFTYYNNLRPYSNIKPLEYDQKPDSIRITYDKKEVREQRIKDKKAKPLLEERELKDEELFTSVSSGGPAKKVTFRFWLEGWDADCFDGLATSINVRLLFNSKPKDMSK